MVIDFVFDDGYRPDLEEFYSFVISQLEVLNEAGYSKDEVIDYYDGDSWKHFVERLFECIVLHVSG